MLTLFKEPKDCEEPKEGSIKGSWEDCAEKISVVLRKLRAHQGISTIAWIIRRLRLSGEISERILILLKILSGTS